MNFGAEFIILSTVRFTPELLRCIPAELVRKYRVLPVSIVQGRLAIALTDIGNLNVQDHLTHALNRELEVKTVDKLELDIFIERFYGDDNSAN